MVVMQGHFDGQQVILDGEIPKEIPLNARVKIVYEEERPASVISKISALAMESDLPSDFSEQHEHYVKGTPRR